MYGNYPKPKILMGSTANFHYQILRSKKEMDLFIGAYPSSLVIFHNNNRPDDLSIIVDTVIHMFKKVGKRATFNLDQIPPGKYGWADKLREMAPYPGVYLNGIMVQHENDLRKTLAKKSRTS